jgi:hypothetical protein
MGFFNNDAGDLSMLRLIAFMVTCASIVFGLIGCIAFLINPTAEALGIVTVSVGALTGAQILKNTGRKLESGK